MRGHLLLRQLVFKSLGNLEAPGGGGGAHRVPNGRDKVEFLALQLDLMNSLNGIGLEPQSSTEGC